MKKTLLIAAAALAASVMTSQAQVYSQNIVGYVNIPETAATFSLEAPPLDLDGTGTNNTLATVYPNPSLGDQVYLYSPASGFDIVSYTTYKVGGKNGTTFTNWVDGNSGLPSPGTSLNVGQSVYYLPAINETNTFVGQVLSGTVTNGNVPAAATFNLVSSQIPYGGGITTVLNYHPTLGDQVYLYSASSGFDIVSYTTYKVGGKNGTTFTNWVDGNSGLPSEPQISVGQGFWLVPAASGTTWSETLTNN